MTCFWVFHKWHYLDSFNRICKRCGICHQYWSTGFSDGWRDTTLEKLIHDTKKNEKTKEEHQNNKIRALQYLQTSCQTTNLNENETDL